MATAALRTSRIAARIAIGGIGLDGIVLVVVSAGYGGRVGLEPRLPDEGWSPDAAMRVEREVIEKTFTAPWRDGLGSLRTGENAHA